MAGGQVDDEGVPLGEIAGEGVPDFHAGGRVERTGIALVHEGECITLCPDAEAQIASDGGADGVVINYYFPVEIEVVGALSDEQVRRVSECVFDELARELDSRV